MILVRNSAGAGGSWFKKTVPRRALLHTTRNSTIIGRISPNLLCSSVLILWRSNQTRLIVKPCLWQHFSDNDITVDSCMFPIIFNSRYTSIIKYANVFYKWNVRQMVLKGLRSLKIMYHLTLDLTYSVKKRNHDKKKTHLLKQPCHFNLLLQVFELLYCDECIMWLVPDCSGLRFPKA